MARKRPLCTECDTMPSSFWNKGDPCPKCGSDAFKLLSEEEHQKRRLARGAPSPATPKEKKENAAARKAQLRSQIPLLSIDTHPLRALVSVAGFVHTAKAPTALKSAFSATTQEGLHNELIEGALNGLREEAVKVGANAVLGVKITTNSSDPAQTLGASFKSIETVIATGTAVVLSDSDKTSSAVQESPTNPS